MSKHLFEFVYGRLMHHGEIAKETPQTYVLRGRTRPIRVYKARGVTVLETDNPAAVLSAFAATYNAPAAEIAKLKEALLAAQHQQLVDAFKAAGLDDPFNPASKAGESTD